MHPSTLLTTTALAAAVMAAPVRETSTPDAVAPADTKRQLIYPMDLCIEIGCKTPRVGTYNGKKHHEHHDGEHHEEEEHYEEEHHDGEHHEEEHHEEEHHEEKHPEVEEEHEEHGEHEHHEENHKEEHHDEEHHEAEGEHEHQHGDEHKKEYEGHHEDEHTKKYKHESRKLMPRSDDYRKAELRVLETRGRKGFVCTVL